LLLFYRAPGGDPRALARLALLHGIERIRGESEDSALKTAYRACVTKQIAGVQVETNRVRDGNRAAVE
jgi:hypothetical protein